MRIGQLRRLQQELGTSDQVNRIRRDDPDRANEASVRLKLQADCDTFSVEQL